MRSVAEIPHGTLVGYRHHRCRCVDCRVAQADAIREYRRAAVGDPLPADDSRHGTSNGYNNHACRCDRCRQAHRSDHQRWPKRLAKRSGRGTISEHGTHSRYNYGCRCDACATAESVYAASARARRQPLAPDDHRHGTLGGYTNWNCRCDKCKATARRYRQGSQG